MRVEDVDTPALILERAPFERNLQRMANFARDQKIRLRPHAKMHKTPAVALRQIALGAVGVCCQKTSEAEVLVAHGVKDVLVSNQVVGSTKLARLAGLARHASIGLCVDNAENASAVAEACRAAETRMQIYIEINVGANRCGVEPGQDALALARHVSRLPALEFMGLQAYQGSAQHLRTPDERRTAIHSASESARSTRDLIVADGIACPIVTGAGTGTFQIEAGSGIYNELQPGSYAFMDADYGRNQTEDPFENSLFILTSVMSRSADRAVVDCGLKAHSIDSGMAVVSATAAGKPVSGIDYVKASDEHGVIVSTAGSLPDLGAKLRLIPGHIDPTVNLHDWIVVVSDGVVVDVWAVAARGGMW